MAYVGEIRMMANRYPPDGWAPCDGRTLPIEENETLFMLIGTTYGGDGQSTFALPDLRGRVPLSIGGGEAIGDSGGIESVALTVAQLPPHNHVMACSGAPATSGDPRTNLAAAAPPQVLAYGTGQPYQPINGAAVSAAGGSQPHENRQPYLAINFVIALTGLVPSVS